MNIWAAQVRRHLKMSHRLACVTDCSDGIDASIDIIDPPREFEDVRIPTWGDDRPQCLRRIAMFRPDAGAIFGERFVSMDIDVVITGALDPLFEGGEDFRICAGTAPGRPYNGSLMMIRAGCRPQAYTEFTPDRAAEAGKKFLGSDQAWISYILGPDERTWTHEDGVTWAGSGHDGHVVFYNGSRKPWNYAQHTDDPFVAEHYTGNAGGRCLILGYEDGLWRDVAAALAGRPIDAVIASPEAARHWPGEVLAIAGTNAEAMRIARMHGFEDIVLCGVRGVE